jgi:CarD family transcriptional regulator
MTTQQKKPSAARHGFKTGESIVYPAHGVGTISAIEEQEVAGMKLELFVIDFEKDKMREGSGRKSDEHRHAQAVGDRFR